MNAPAICTENLASPARRGGLGRTVRTMRRIILGTVLALSLISVAPAVQADAASAVAPRHHACHGVRIHHHHHTLCVARATMSDPFAGVASSW